MRIAMFTNTYLPFVGGLTQSVQQFSAAYRGMGHQVVVVAPEFEGQPENETDVLRVPAIKEFANTRFSVPLPIPARVMEQLDAFAPEIVHAHHPFLLGDSAVRYAHRRNLPVLVTHHTHILLFAQNLPENMPWMVSFVDKLSSRFCNSCDAVIAPSAGIRRELLEAGVTRPIHVIPTGVDEKRFAQGDGVRFRKEQGLPEEAFVIGHVGRLASEKNLKFTLGAMLAAAEQRDDAHVLVVGIGPEEEALKLMASESKIAERVHFVGVCKEQELVDAYTAMDVFAFASLSETQGMVLSEALAAGTPVVAVMARGVEDIVQDGVNGRVLPDLDQAAFAEVLLWVKEQDPEALRDACWQSIAEFTMDYTAGKELALYADLIAAGPKAWSDDDTDWQAFVRGVETELDLAGNLVSALVSALTSSEPPHSDPTTMAPGH